MNTTRQLFVFMFFSSFVAFSFIWGWLPQEPTLKTFAEEQHFPRKGPVVRVLLARTVGIKEIDNAIFDLKQFGPKLKQVHNRECGSFQSTAAQVAIEWLFLWFDDSSALPQFTAALRSEGLDTRVQVVNGTNSSKLEFWRKQLTDAVTDRFDYVWMCDGDVNLANRFFDWNTFWSHLIAVGAAISQPSVVASHRHGRASDWPLPTVTLSKTGGRLLDSRLVAAETTAVEIMCPILKADAWRTVRKAFFAEVSGPLSNRGLDVTWCKLAHKLHFSRPLKEFKPRGKLQRMVLNQSKERMADEWFEKDTIASLKQRSPACAILYATSVVHLDSKTMQKGNEDFKEASRIRMLAVKNKLPEFYGNPKKPPLRLFKC